MGHFGHRHNFPSSHPSDGCSSLSTLNLIVFLHELLVEQLVLADIGCLFASYRGIRMTARPPMANRCCVDRAYHIRLIRSNRVCYYRSSHTFLITDLFAAYHTHLDILNHFCSLVSTQIVHPSKPHAVYRTYLDLADHFFCVA